MIASKRTTARARKTVYLASAALLGLLPISALAQERPAAQDENQLTEIVVTAQRRVENLQDVPIAAIALSGDQLEKKAVDRLADLESASPSLSITEAGETQSVNIRGIGLSSNLPAVTNGVATYVDGLFQAQIVTATPFYDIASVEVLRGPQGTLVGNNSTGGAIFINSATPNTGEVGGYAQGAIGNYDRRELEGAVNLPVNDVLAIRAAGLYRKRDSFYTDVGPFDNKAGRLDERGGRLGVLWKPGQFQALLKLQLHEQESGGFAYRPAPNTTFAAFRVGDERTLSYDSPTSQSEKAFQASLKLQYEFANGVALTSLSGYQNKRNEYLQDTDASQAPISPTGGFVVDYFARDKQYSQELNLISPTDGRFDWILGLYYQHNDILVDYLQLSPGLPTAFVPRQERDIWGAFGQGNYQLSEALRTAAGPALFEGRDQRDRCGAAGRRRARLPADGLAVADLSGSHDDAKPTGKLALNWDGRRRQPDLWLRRARLQAGRLQFHDLRVRAGDGLGLRARLEIDPRGWPHPHPGRRLLQRLQRLADRRAGSRHRGRRRPEPSARPPSRASRPRSRDGSAGSDSTAASATSTPSSPASPSSTPACCRLASWVRSARSGRPRLRRSASTTRPMSRPMTAVPTSTRRRPPTAPASSTGSTWARPA
jgi:iron complex outermembrane receptor protein